MRHESITALEKLNELPIQVLHKVKEQFSPAIYTTNYAAITATDSKKVSGCIALNPKMVVPLFISIPSSGGAAAILKAAPVKTLSPGSFFKGTLCFTSKNDVEKKPLELFDVKLFVDYDLGASVKTNGTAKADPSEKEKKELFEILTSLLTNSRLPKEQREKLLSDLESDETGAKDPRLLLAKMDKMIIEMESDNKEKAKQQQEQASDAGGEVPLSINIIPSSEKLYKLINLADDVLKAIDIDVLSRDLASLKLKAQNKMIFSPKDTKK